MIKLQKYPIGIDISHVLILAANVKALDDKIKTNG